MPFQIHYETLDNAAPPSARISHDPMPRSSMTSAQQGGGRKMVESVVAATPSDWLLTVPFDWSGGFRAHMADEYARIQIFRRRARPCRHAADPEYHRSGYRAVPPIRLICVTSLHQTSRLMSSKGG